MNRTQLSEEDKERILHELNDDELDKLIPVTIFLSIIALIGMAGNSLVIHIYRTKFTFSNVQCFVLTLAAIDLFSCCVAIPLEIVTVIDQFTFKPGWLCKLARFVNGVCTNSSTFLLIMIAVDRFRKIIKSFEWQIKAVAAKLLCVASVFLATMISWPALIIYGTETVDVPKFNITGSECGTVNDLKDTSFPGVYTLSLAIMFICSVVALVTLYCLIGRKVRSHVQSMNEGLRNSGSKAYIKNQRTARRTTFVMFLVTIGFICSFLPHLTVRQFKSKFVADGSSTGSEAVYKILTRSYFLNCAVNPIIYSIFDSRFRKACKGEKSPEVTATSDSQTNNQRLTCIQNDTTK